MLQPGHAVWLQGDLLHWGTVETDYAARTDGATVTSSAAWLTVRRSTDSLTESGVSTASLGVSGR